MRAFYFQLYILWKKRRKTEMLDVISVLLLPNEGAPAQAERTCRSTCWQTPAGVCVQPSHWSRTTFPCCTHNSLFIGCLIQHSHTILTAVNREWPCHTMSWKLKKKKKTSIFLAHSVSACWVSSRYLKQPRHWRIVSISAIKRMNIWQHVKVFIYLTASL